MPILQNKLVMKSIEALHDEALSLVPDTASNHGVTAPPAVLHAATPPQESPIDAPKDTSADVPSESASDHDIMARIDHLLKKLDEDDDVAIAPLTDEGPQSNTGTMTGDAGDTATADTITIDNPANPDSPVLSDVADHANENAILDVAVDGLAEDTADKALSKIGDNANDDVIDETSDKIFADDQSGQTIPSDQTQALADIAAAIYQARQQAVDTVVADASQNNAVPFDMDVLSAAVADEVRRTVSAVMIAELPQMVRDAVGEAIRALPADVRGQSTPTTGNPSTAKRVAARKTAAIKKAVAKKAVAKKTGTKKAGTKKPAAKKATSKKASAKKTAPST